MRNVRIYTRAVGDKTAYWHAPPTLREVLEWEVEIVYLGTTRADETATIYAVQQWLSRYVEIDCTPFNSGHLPLFEVDELLRFGWEVAASASFGPDEIKPLAAILHVNEGADEYDRSNPELPCECPACRTPLEHAPDESCKFFGMSVNDRQMVNRLSLVASDPAWLDAPTWLYQFATEKKFAAGQGMAALRQRAEKASKEDEEQQARTASAADIQREVFGRVMHGPHKGT